MTNPWTDRFTPLLSMDGLRESLDQRPKPLLSLADQLPYQAAISLSNTFKNELYIATESRTQVAHRLVQIMYAHCVTTYTGESAFLTGLYADYSDADLMPLMILTGLAGVGKSRLLTRIQDAMGNASFVEVDHQPSRFSVEGLSRVVIGDESSVLQVLRSFPFVDAKAIEGSGGKKALLAHARNQIFRRGIPMLAADEMQFLSKSEATNMITTLLLHLCYLKIQALVLMNYSLGHKLWRRFQQEGDRLLTVPITLEPEAAGSPDWVKSISGRIDVAPEIFTFQPEALATKIHPLTFGIDRYVNELLVMAYSVARSQGRHQVCFADIDRAYKSSQFNYTRDTVEELRRIRTNGKSENGRLDLVNPFEDRDADEAKAITVKEEVEAAKQGQRIFDCLTEGEKASLEQIRKAAGGPKASNGGSKVIPRKKSKTAEGLLDALKSHLREGS